MYRLIRNTHLALGLFGCLFLLMYGLSAVQMSHPSWFARGGEAEANEEQEFRVDPSSAATPRQLAQVLMDQYELRGELGRITSSDEGYRFTIRTTGTQHEVEYFAADQRVKVQTRRAGFLGMLNRIHHASGLWHEYALFNAWGLLVGLVSVCLLVLGGTGIYLWFKLYNERAIGLVLLAIGLGYSLTLFGLIQAAG